MKVWSGIGTAALALSISLSAMGKPVTAVLRIKEKIPMSEFAKDVRNPSSARFGKFYTPEEIRAFSAPSAGEYNQLITQLRSEGFTIVGESTTHLWVTVRGDSTVFENVFSTQLKTTATGARRALAKAQVPARMPLVASVIGLDNTRHAVPKLKIRATALDQNSGIPQATIKTAYGLDPLYAQGLSGRGQHISIATYMAFNIDQVNTFYTTSNLKPGPSVDQVMFNGTPDADPSGNSAVETQLDAEFSGMIAPGASIHVFASATNDDAGEAQMFTAILDDNRAKVVNYSWGDCETQLASDHKTEMETIFQRATAQGVNLMIASGDSGSDSCGDGTNMADWPAANDNVVAVGGTTFSFDNGKINETGWSGSGGGISAIWALPAWQQSLGAPYTMRSYPDVSFNADPDSGQAMYADLGDGEGPIWLIIGGTSMAAPQWSGYMALVGEARANAGKGALGFLPPLIYPLSATSKASVFNDVTSGNNGLYTAAPGWDAVTGWGSMQGANLLNVLVQ